MAEVFERRRELRLQLRSRRAQLDTVEQEAAAMAVTARLVRVKVLCDATTVAGYRAVRGEVDIDAAMALMAVSGTTITVPRVIGEHLEFLPWDLEGVTVSGSFGIPEPVDGVARPLLGHDVALVPLVAFDSSGNRLGQGGGYYDRALSQRSSSSLVVIGIAHSFQQVDAIPIESWDMPLDAVVTEEGIEEFTPGCLDASI